MAKSSTSRIWPGIQQHDVMAGLVPAIHAVPSQTRLPAEHGAGRANSWGAVIASNRQTSVTRRRVDGRVKPGHDVLSLDTWPGTKRKSWLPRRSILFLGLGLGLLPLRVMAVDEAAVQAPIAALDAALIAAMKAGKATPFPQRAAALSPVLDAAFDLPTILQVSVGPGWAQLPQAQQTSLLDVFKRFTTVTYTANFESFSGERFEILPELRSAGSDQIVQTSLIAASGTATPLDYVMRPAGAGWKAVDVLLDGAISRVAVQRSDFRSLLKPGDASALIESLQRKVEQLSAGTM